MRALIAVAIMGLICWPVLAQDAAPDWVENMKQVHAKFTGEKGTLANFGDSITVTLAYWSPLQYGRKNMDKKAQDAFELVSGYMQKDCWAKWKGPEYGSTGMMTIRWASDNVDKWLKKLNPEVAVMMFGTNDLHALKQEEYETKTREVVKKCLDNGTILILTTPPPRHGFEEKAKLFADTVRKIAKDMKVALCDFHEAVVSRRPKDWDGAADEFKEYKDYDVPAPIARDGVHPSNPKKWEGDYSEEALKNNGFALRNYVTLLSYAEVIQKVLKDDKPATKPAP